jgi:hypothetical protein
MRLDRYDDHDVIPIIWPAEVSHKQSGNSVDLDLNLNLDKYR